MKSSLETANYILKSLSEEEQKELSELQVKFNEFTEQMNYIGSLVTDNEQEQSEQYAYIMIINNMREALAKHILDKYCYTMTVTD